MTTQRARVVAYIDQDSKEALERLAAMRRRSVSNLIEVLIDEAVRDAIKSGEIKPQETPPRPF